MADKDKIFIYEDGRQKVLKDADRLVLKSALAFEGSTDDGFETELAFTDPTDDRTITFPDETGDVALLQSGTLPSPSSIPVKNPSTTTALTKGQVVYISGHSGNKPEVSLARSNSSSTMPAFGFVTANIAAEAEGYITTSGLIKGISTNSFSLGDTLYVSESNAGEIVSSAPTGSNLIQNIGKIVKVDASNGEIMVGGSGRTNATPNLNQGNFFIGNASNQSSESVYTLPISDGTNGQVLTTNGSGAVTFQDAAGGSSDLVNDTTPQLGGTLDLNSQAVQGDLIPSAVDTYNLGSTSAEWRDLYLGDNSTIFFGNDSDTKLIHRADSGLKLELLTTSEGSTEPVFEMIARSTSSVSGPVLILNHQGSSSNNNIAGTLRFQADTSSSNTFYSYLYTTVKERTHANHAGELNFVVKSNGSNTVPMQLTGNSSDSNVVTRINKILNVNDHDGTTGLQLAGTLITTTAAELNVIDGDTSATSTTLVDADRVVVNDAGTMKQVALTDVMTYVNANVSGGGGSSAADDITAGDAAVNITTTSGNITIDAQGNDSDIIFKGTDNNSDITMLTLDGSDAGTAILNNNLKLKSDYSVLYFGSDDDVFIQHDPDDGLKFQVTYSNESIRDPRFTFETTSGNNSLGPYLTFMHSGSDSNNDTIGNLEFRAATTTSNILSGTTDYALIKAKILDRTNATRSAEVSIATQSNGISTTALQVYGNSSNTNVITKINKIVNVADHDGTTGLQLAGTLVTSTAAELNLLDGASLGNANEVITVDSGGNTFASNSGMIFESGGQIAIGVSASDPSNRTNYAHLYSKDVSSSAELFVRDEAGNVTQISPHNEEGDWIYWSENIKTGKKVKVNMEKMIRRLEEITGESFFEEYIEGV